MLETMTENHVQLVWSIWRFQCCYRWWADATMLSGESANGKYPLSVTTMLIDKNAQTFLKNMDVWTQDSFERNLRQKLWLQLLKMPNSMDIKLVVIFTKTGHTARLISKYRPNADILKRHLTNWQNVDAELGVLSQMLTEAPSSTGMTCLKQANAKQLKLVCTIWWWYRYRCRCNYLVKQFA